MLRCITRKIKTRKKKTRNFCFKIGLEERKHFIYFSDISIGFTMIQDFRVQIMKPSIYIFS